MAINVKVKVNEIEEGFNYPLLMENTFGVIVLMTRDGTGTVIKKNTNCSEGYRSCSWSMENFKPFNGTIELSNK